MTEETQPKSSRIIRRREQEKKVTTAVSLDRDTLVFIDDMVEKKRFASRSHGIDFAVQRLKEEMTAEPQAKIIGVSRDNFDTMDLLSLPPHLQKTAIALTRQGRATAEDIAKVTRRARAVESAYLNQLTTLHFITHQREGRKVYFSVCLPAK